MFICMVLFQFILLVDQPVIHSIDDAELIELSDGYSAQYHYTVTEIFSSSSEEDFMRILGNGYPSNVISEIFDNNSIPEEDRFWLDCRLRSKIAQVTHIFTNRNGVQIQLNAEWITPGENYWQEHLVAKLTVDEIVSLPLSSSISNVSPVFTSYGENIGFINTPAPDFVKLSRDGSIGVIQGGGRRAFLAYGTDLYIEVLDLSGGSERIQIENPVFYAHDCNAVSNDGNLYGYGLSNINDDTDSYLVVNTASHEEVLRINLQGSPVEMTFSPNSRFVAFSDFDEVYSGVLDLEKNELFLSRTNGTSVPAFSSNSRYVVLPEILSASYIYIMDLLEQSIKKISHNNLEQLDVNFAGEWYISNDGNILTMGNILFGKKSLLFRDELSRQCIISPSGNFMLVEYNQFHLLNDSKMFKYSLYSITDNSGEF